MSSSPSSRSRVWMIRRTQAFTLARESLIFTRPRVLETTPNSELFGAESWRLTETTAQWELSSPKISLPELWAQLLEWCSTPTILSERFRYEGWRLAVKCDNTTLASHSDDLLLNFETTNFAVFVSLTFCSLITFLMRADENLSSLLLLQSLIFLLAL